MPTEPSAARARNAASIRRGDGALPIYLLRLPAGEIVRLLRAEIAESGGAPELYLSAYRDYVIEEDFDRAAYGTHGGSEYDLVVSEAVLEIEPRLERNYWVLSVVVRRELGPRIIADENALLGAPLTLDTFAAELSAPGRAAVIVRLATETVEAKAHFDAWWADLSARHPPAPGAADMPQAAASTAGRSTERNDPMPHDPLADDAAGDATMTYRTREAVAAFPDADALESAVVALEVAGFDRARISVLGSEAAVRKRLGRLYRSVAEAEEDPNAPRSAFVTRAEREIGESAAVTFPLFIGGLAGAAAVIGSGGALAGAIAAMILGGAAGGGIGGVLAGAMSRAQARRVAEQVAQGGLVLWVSLADAAAEGRAVEVLQQVGGRDVHVHEIERAWGPESRPLAEAQVDPLLLERDPEP